MGWRPLRPCWGGFFYSQGELSQVCLHYEQSIQLAHQIQNPVGSLTSYGAIGRVFYAQGEFDQAIQHFEKALELVREVGEQTLVIWLSNALVYAFGARKEWLQAARYFEQAVRIAREIGGVYWEIMLNINLAEVAYSLDKEKLAVQHYQAAAEIARQHPEIPVSWLLAYSAGKAALLSGDLASAGDFLRQALADVAAQNNRDAVGGCLGCLAVWALQARQFERAARLHGIVAGRRWLADPVMPLWMVPYDLDTILAPTRLALGESEYARLYAEGQAMPLEQAVAYALEVING